VSPWKGRRIVLLCEGDTEELATKHFIAREWRNDGLTSIGLHSVNLNGKIQDVPPKTRLYLDESEVLAVFTLIDLFGMDRVEHPSDDPVDAKVERVRHWFRSKLEHARKKDFHPHVCVHESEAWLLAEGAALRRRLDDAGIKPDPHAESRNFQFPPQRRLNDLFLKFKKDRYHKIRDGRPLFSALEFAPVYKTCGYFRAFYDDLRSVGKNSLS
jgi:Domain of unknown function (DUF4276)